MTTVSLPHPDAVELFGEPPAGVEIVVWDGLTARPDGAEDIEFFVGGNDGGAPSASVLGGLPALRVLQVTSAGVESWLPVLPAGVQLCNGRGIHGGSTAELAVGGLIAALRDLPSFVAQQQRHDWDRRPTDGLAGLEVLVLGAGDIGRRVAAAVELFDASATMVARRARDDVRAMDDLPQLLPHANAVVVALPSTPETAGLVDAEFLAALPDGAVVVNIARGALVDTSALLAELTARRLRAFLDVTDPEPLPADHPLWDAPNLLITPHVGGGTTGWQQRAYAFVRDQVRRYVAGEDLANQVSDGY